MVCLLPSTHLHLSGDCLRCAGSPVWPYLYSEYRGEVNSPESYSARKAFTFAAADLSGGLGNTYQAFLKLLPGKNLGKQAVALGEEREEAYEKLPNSMRELLCCECITLPDISDRQPPFKPLHPLLRRAVGKGLRRYSAPGTALQIIVSNLSDGLQGSCDILLLDDPPFGCMMPPHPGETVGLQLNPDG